MKELICLVFAPQESTERFVINAAQHADMIPRICRFPAEVMDHLRKERVHTLVLDYDRCEGLSVPELRAFDSDLFIVAVTERPNASEAIRAFREGASDYVASGHPGDLREALQRGLGERGILLGNPKAEIQRLVGREIRARRRALGFTLTELARRAGVSYSLIAGAERGEKALSLPSLVKITIGLRTPISLLVKPLGDLNRLQRTGDHSGPSHEDGPK